MKTKIIYFILLISLFSCRKDNIKAEEELTQVIQKKITQELQKDFIIKSIKLVKTDTLTDSKEIDIIVGYSTYKAIRLNELQKQLIKELDSIKIIKNLEVSKSKYKKISDSIRYYLQIGEKVKKIESKNIKTGNYQAVFLTEVLNKKTNKVKTDSLFLFVDKKNMIYMQTEFVAQLVKKYSK